MAASLPLYDPAGTQRTDAQRANSPSAAAFGGSQARALAGIGQAAQQLGGNMMAIEAKEREKDETVQVMDVYTEGTGRMRKALYGEGGLYSRTGTNADGLAATVGETSDTIRNDLIKRLPSDAAKTAFNQMWDRHSESTLNQATGREFEQRAAVRTTAKTAALANLEEEAVANYNDEEMLATTWDATRAMIRANPDGLPPEAVARVERETLSAMNVQVIQRLSQDSPGRALDYYNQHKGMIHGADHAQVNSIISGVAKVREAKDAATQISSAGPAGNIIKSIIKAETGGEANPAAAVSSTGAAGHAQLMPGTAREVALKAGMPALAAMSDDELATYWQTPQGQRDNIKLGSIYYGDQLKRYNGDVEAATIAYNAGPANADKWLNAGRDYSALPMPEQTLPYVKRAMSAYTGKTIEGNSSTDIQRALNGGGSNAYFEGDARAFLKSKLQAQHGAEHVDGMTAPLADRLAAMFNDAPDFAKEGLDILSGTRSRERQVQLWADAVAKYGSPEAARKWVAPPSGEVVDGKASKGSNHEHGNAADLGWKGGKFRDAPQEVVDWVHANAERYGLTFPLSNEAWHIETKEARGGQAAKRDRVTKGDVADARVNLAVTISQPDGLTVEVAPPKPGDAADIYAKSMSPFTVSPSAPTLDDWLASARAQYADNPSLLAEVERQLTDEANVRTNAVETEVRSATLEVFRGLVGGKAVADYDPQMLEKIGPDGVGKLLTLEGKLKPGAKDETDDATYYRLTKMPPEEFAKYDLLQDVDKLSQTDLKTFADRQAALAKPNASAGRRSTDASRSDVLGSVDNMLGLDVNGKPEDAATMAVFTRKFNGKIEAYIEANGGKEPNGTEMQQMADDLMLEGAVSGGSVPLLGMLGAKWADKTLRVFEMTPDQLNEFRVAETVDDIPPDVQPSVARAYRGIYQFEPNEDGAIQMYNDMVVVQQGGSPSPPKDITARITQALANKLNRMPSEDEVALAYREAIKRTMASK